MSTSETGDGAASAAPAGVSIGDRLEWASVERVLKVNGRRFKLKGLNWFGFETPENCLHGLWQRSMEDFLAQVSKLGFNALRIPFSVQLALAMDTTTPPENQVAGDPTLKGLTCGAILDRLFESCAAKGILIMLDQHRLHPDRGISDVWYDDEFPMERVLESWDVLVARFKRHWNLFALDLKNENHGIANWGTGEPFSDWKMAAERVMKHVHEKHPDWNGFFFVGGVWVKGGFWWGGNFTGVRDKPVDLGSEELNRRVVYTPHVYGPDVYKQSYFYSLRFPHNMPDIWDAHWGFIRHMPHQRAVVVGEWGGFCRGKDAVWQKRLAAYLKQTGMTDNFYWCLNPNSGDTGGILDDDWTTPKADKLGILHDIQPQPSRVTRAEDGTFRFEESITVEEVPAPPPKQGGSKCAPS